VKRKTKILWMTDPWHTLDHPNDTTLRFMQEAAELGIQQDWCDVKTLRLENQKVGLDSKTILGMDPSRKAEGFQWGELKTLQPKDYSSIHYRTDPPVDLNYLHPLHLLSLSLQGVKSCEVVNPLEVLFSCNEKIEAAAIPKLLPPSVVSSQWEQLLRFGKSQGRTVLKPLHEAQSHGIELLDWRTSDGIETAQALLNEATSRFQTPVILQKYLEGISEGEVRLWFLDGKLVAHVKKMPLSGDFRVDMDRGSQLAAHRLTRTEKSTAEKISKHLKKRKIRLAAIDLIDGLATDFNFTSPGLIVQIEALTGDNLSRKILKALIR